MFRRTMLALSLALVGAIAPAWQVKARQNAGAVNGDGRRIGKRRSVSHNTGAPRTTHKGKHTNRAARARRRVARLNRRR